MWKMFQLIAFFQSHNTNSTEASVEKMKVYVSKTEKREEPVAIKKGKTNQSFRKILILKMVVYPFLKTIQNIV